MHAEVAAAAEHDARMTRRFSAAHPEVALVSVPALPVDVHDLDGLRGIGDLLGHRLSRLGGGFGAAPGRPYPGISWPASSTPRARGARSASYASRWRCSGLLAAGLMLPYVGGLGLAAGHEADKFLEHHLQAHETQPPQKTTLYASDGKTVIATLFNQDRVPVPLADRCRTTCSRRWSPPRTAASTATTAWTCAG